VSTNSTRANPSRMSISLYHVTLHTLLGDLGDNCIVFDNFTASIKDLMVANWVYWRRVRGASKRIFATIKSTIDAV